MGRIGHKTSDMVKLSCELTIAISQNSFGVAGGIRDRPAESEPREEVRSRFRQTVPASRPRQSPMISGALSLGQSQDAFGRL